MSNQSTIHKTAVITGASSGLGAEFARQLAASGYDLLLAARREDRLRLLADTLHSSHGIRVHIHPTDLSSLPGIESLISIVNELGQVDLLVNNAGFGTVGRFFRVDPEKELAMLTLHMLAPVMLSRAVLPGMVSHNQGAIINVSSLAGLIPIRNVLYHSTKAFLVSFSETLHTELSGTNVHIQVLCPGFILTEFHDTVEYARFSRRGVPKFLWMLPDKVVIDSLKSIQHDHLICIPGVIYKIAGALSRNSISAGLIKYVAGLVLQKRNRGKNSGTGG